jgi:aldose 1-epimerase
VIELGAGRVHVVIDPDAGGRLAQVVIDGRARLRGPAPGLAWHEWGSYPLLPWSNRIPGGRFTFDGVEHAVPVTFGDGTAIHGLAATVPWAVVEATATAAQLSVEVTAGPYRAVGDQRLTVDAGGLTQTLAVTNAGDRRLPFGLGIHPWFAGAPVMVPADEIWDGDEPVPSGPPRPVHEAEDLRTARTAPPIDRDYTALTAAHCTIGDLALRWEGPVTDVVVYRGDPAWVCVEPVTMANGALERTTVLDPGGTLQVGYRLERA